MWRTVAEGRRWSSLCAFALLLLGTLSAVLWVLGNGIPYGYDASGTYLTYRAAYNSTAFSGENPLVADVSASPDPATHPTYNQRSPDAFGQILSQLLLRTDISDLRMHTGLAIGISLFGIFVAIKVLTRLGGPALSAATTLLFAFQYIGVLTWTTNLQTALCFPLFWGNLYVLQRYVDRPSRLRLAAVAGGIAAVFVNDLALGAFVLLTEVCLFWQLPRPSSAKLTLTLSTTAGAATALLVMFAVTGPGVFEALLPVDIRDQGQQIPSAIRAMFALGQGPLALLVYGVLLAELARAVWSALPHAEGVWRFDLAVLLALIVSISVAVWLDRSTSLVDDWELLVGRPIAHVGLWLALVGLLFAFGLRIARGKPILADGFSDGVGRDELTARSFVVAVGFAALILAVLPIGNFTETYIRNYHPALVFLEDVVLAVFGLTLIGKICEAGRWSVQSVAIAAILIVVGSYWLLYQGKLAMRFPPREIGVASALRGNVALAGAAFIAPELPHVVWYYTRGSALAQDLGSSEGPAFVVCARLPTDQPPPIPIECGRWTQLLGSSEIDVGPWQRLYRTADYLIYALQPCGAPNLPVQETNTACDAQAGSPPSLEPLGGAPNAPSVELKVTLEPTASLAHVDYQYTQGAGTLEEGSIVRLYALRSTGSWCLLEETAGSPDIHFPPASAGQFRAAVIPRSTLAVGQPYFSESQQVRTPYVVDLPNTRDGGVQQIQADSLEDAQQQAIAAGTWTPGAGTLGPDSRHLYVEAPTADQQCRR